MEIEITPTADGFMKHIFKVNPNLIKSEASQLQNKLDEDALERLLHTEPASYQSAPKDTPEDIIKSTTHLSKARLNEYRDTFAIFDKNKEGKITQTGLHQIMHSLGQYITSTELQDILETYRIHDEYFSFEQFVHILSLPEDPDQTSEELKKTFRVFDKRNVGYINASDLRNVWLSFDISLSDDEIDQMIEEVDVDGDGRINFDEFVSAIIMLEENDDQKINDN